MATSSNTPKGYATRTPCRNPPLKADSVILQQTLSGIDCVRACLPLRRAACVRRDGEIRRHWWQSRGSRRSPRPRWLRERQVRGVARGSRAANVAANSSGAEQHVEDVVALLAAGFSGGRGGDGALGCWRNAIPVDHPGARLDTAGDQVLRLGGGGGATIHDVAAGGEAGGAEKTKAQCQSGGDQGLRHG